MAIANGAVERTLDLDETGALMAVVRQPFRRSTVGDLHLLDLAPDRLLVFVPKTGRARSSLGHGRLLDVDVVTGSVRGVASDLVPPAQLGFQPRPRLRSGELAAWRPPLFVTPAATLVLFDPATGKRRRLPVRSQGQVTP